MRLLSGQIPAVNWLAFFALILLAWGGLFLMATQGAGGDLAAIYGADFWVSLCSTSALHAGYGSLFVMWALMAAAMMAPTFVPALRTFGDLTYTSAATRVTFGALVIGYLLVWVGYALIAAGAQYALVVGGLITPFGTSLSWGLNAGLLLVAGLYQFSALKEACLNRCRTPLTFFMAHYALGGLAALKMGARLGVVCLGCCWALMALAFVGGTMNLIWMGLATVIMVVEKLPDIGKYITRPLGAVLLLGALGSGVMAALG